MNIGECGTEVFWAAVPPMASPQRALRFWESAAKHDVPLTASFLEIVASFRKERGFRMVARIFYGIERRLAAGG